LGKLEEEDEVLVLGLLPPFFFPVFRPIVGGGWVWVVVVVWYGGGGSRAQLGTSTRMKRGGEEMRPVRFGFPLDAEFAPVNSQGLFDSKYGFAKSQSSQLRIT
jgi:hypothetical protein